MNRSVGRLTVLLVFAISRIVIASSDQRESTLAEVNVRYALEAQRAASRGASFYRLHEEERALKDPASVPAEREVEYPPLAILWMRAPTWFLDPIPNSGLVSDSYVTAAKRANRIAMFLVDICGFGILALMGATEVQLAIYTAGGLLLFPVLYERMDLLLGVLLLGAMALLVRRFPYWAPLAVLALAINFKMTPVVLVPLFVLGTLPADALSSFSRAQTWRLIGERIAILSVMGAAMFLPFFAKDGFATLGFLRYHLVRGLEIAAVWNSLPIALAALVHWPATAALRFGAIEVQSPWSGPLRAMASVCTAAVIPVLALVLWKLLARLDPPSRKRGVGTLAQANPAFFLASAVICLLTAISTAHVLSPQYLLWLVPLAPLWEGRFQVRTAVVFLTICALTTASFPFFFGRLLHMLSTGNRGPLWSRLLWPAPLIARNVLLVGFTAWLWIGTFRQLNKVPPDRSPAEELRTGSR